MQFVDVVVDTLPAFRPGVPAVFADVDAAHFDAGDHPVRCPGVDVDVPDLGELLVTGQPPLLARREFLEPVEFPPRQVAPRFDTPSSGRVC